MLFWQQTKRREAKLGSLNGHFLGVSVPVLSRAFRIANYYSLQNRSSPRMEAFAINILLLVEDRGEVSKDLVPRDVPQLEDQLMLVQQQLFVLEASLSCDPAEVPIFYCFPTLSWDYTILHNEPEAPQNHRESCRIQTQDRSVHCALPMRHHICCKTPNFICIYLA